MTPLNPLSQAFVTIARQTALDHGLLMSEVWPRFVGIKTLRREPRLIRCRAHTIYKLRAEPVGKFARPSYPEIAAVLNEGYSHSTIIDYFQIAEREGWTTNDSAIPNPDKAGEAR